MVQNFIGPPFIKTTVIIKTNSQEKINRRIEALLRVELNLFYGIQNTVSTALCDAS